MRKLFSLALIGAAFVLTACGGDSDPTANEPTAAPTTDPATQARLDKLEKEVADTRRQRAKARKARKERARAQARRKERAQKEAAATPEATQEAASEDGGGITVPNVVGLDHQAAQNAMQGEGLYNLAEKDCSGQGRLLLFDRNWEVVKTTPPGGAHVSEDTKITICSVKQGEQ
jgi:hypothetical protein